MPQVLQLNEMQPCCGKKGSPIALDTLPSKYAHTNRAPFSSCPHTVPAPTRLMFIHQPLTGQMQRPFKTKSDLFINDGGRAGRRDGRLPSTFTAAVFGGSLPRADHRGYFHWGRGWGRRLSWDSRRVGLGGGRLVWRPQGTARWKNFRRQVGMKRRRETQRMRPCFHC